MNDMRPVITPKSDQLNSDDLIAGPITITITDVKIMGGQEQPVSIYFHGDNGKPWKPCKSMSRVMVNVWGPDAKVYVGRSLTLYRDPDVKWGGMAVGGIRISHMSDITGRVQMALTATKGQRKPHTVLPLVMTKPKAAAPANSDAPKRTVSTVKAEIDAITDADGLQSWLAANEAMKTSDKETVKNLYVYAAGLLEAMLAAQSATADAEVSEDESID
jgi:hypothetical protein